MNWSYQEYFDMFMVLGECRKNYRQAAKRTLNVVLIVKKNRIWHLNGHRNILLPIVLWRKRKEHEEKAINDENAINILAAIQLNPTISIRQLERECKLNRKSPRILHENKFHPYHIHLHQSLENPDFVSRRNEFLQYYVMY